MQKFVDNWSVPLELAPGVTSWEVDLADGDYTITFSDSLGLTATRWEIVSATVSAGVATLVRGQQGTADQDWPAGSVAYQAVTAGFLMQLQAQIAGAAAGQYSIMELEVPDGGLTETLPTGIGHVDAYLAAEEPQQLTLIVPPLLPGVGVLVGRLRVYMEGIELLTLAVPASDDITYDWASARYDNAVFSVSMLSGAFGIAPLDHDGLEPWCVLAEFFVSESGGQHTVTVLLTTAARPGPGGTSGPWSPPDPV